MPHKLPNDDALAKVLQKALDLEWIFPHFTAADMAKYFLTSALYRYPRGTSVIAQGEDGRDIYVIQTGSVAVYREEGGQAVYLSTLKAGDVFGHVGFLHGSRRSAHVVAKDDSHIFHLVFNDIKFMRIKNKELGLHLEKFALDRS